MAKFTTLTTILILSFNAFGSIDRSSSKAVFTPNRGQVQNEIGEFVPDVLVKSSQPGLDFYITRQGFTYVFLNAPVAAERSSGINIPEKVNYSRVDVVLKGSQITEQQIRFLNPTAWQSNYYVGDAKAENVSHFSKIVIENVYPGIDWIWQINERGQLEYDFLVHPFADASLLRMKYLYANPVVGDSHVKISTTNGAIVEGPLKAQSASKEVDVRYSYDASENELRFELGSFPSNEELWIDPPLALQWSAQYGGTFSDGLRGVATDSSGSIFTTGYTNSSNFPVWNAGGNAYFDGSFNGNTDALIMKIDSNDNLKWSTYLGGSGIDFGNSIALDETGGVYVTGGAANTFPAVAVTGAYNQSAAQARDAFVARFTNNLQLNWSTLFGGNGNEEGLKILTDRMRNIYICGYTNSSSFPALDNGGYFQNTGIGDESFIAKFDSSASLLWSTLYGGSDDEYATSLAVDTSGNLVVTGFTTSSDFPVSAGSYQNNLAGATDGFILKFNSAQQRAVATYYGGTGSDYFNDVALGRANTFLFTGRTSSGNFPTISPGGFSFNQISLAGGFDAFVVRCREDMAPSWSTYYGGTGLDVGTGVVCDSNGRVYITGFTFSTDFPLDSPLYAGAHYQTNNRGAADGFIAGFSYLGTQFWSTYKGDTCYEYSADIALAQTNNMLYIVGEGLMKCKSLPDSSDITGSGKLQDGFLWAFEGEHGPSASTSGTGGCFNLKAARLGNTCRNQCVGDIDLEITGGTPPYNIFWEDGSTDQNITGLCKGEHFVQVQDGGGCVKEMTFQIDELRLDDFWIENIGCLAGDYGFAIAMPEGGTPPYRYAWSTGDTSQGIFGLTAAAMYQVTVWDDNGCMTGMHVSVSYIEWDDADFISVIKWPTCNESDGILVAIDGMTGEPKVTTWWDYDGHTSEVTDTLFNVPPGLYFINSGQCMGGQYTNKSLNLDDALLDSMKLEVAQLPSSCANHDGIAIVNIDSSYGYGKPYSFLWSNGDQTQTTNKLKTNEELSVTVTSNRGCADTLSLFLPKSDSVTATIIANPYHCDSGSTATVVASGGKQPYSFLWSTGDTLATVGNYEGWITVTVKDSLQCETKDSALVQLVEPFTAEVKILSPVKCFNDRVEVEVSGHGGFKPYSNDGVFNRPAGLNSFWVYDSTGCEVWFQEIFLEPNKLIVTEQHTSISCFGDKSAITISAMGGTPGYTGTGQFQRPAGEYLFIVRDTNQCSDSLLVVIPEPDKLLIQPVSLDTFSCRLTSWRVVVNALGGTSPYTGSDTLAFETSGSYKLSITDKNGCIADSIINVTIKNDSTRVFSKIYQACPNENLVLQVYDVTNPIWLPDSLPGYLYGIHNLQASRTVFVKGRTSDGCLVADTFHIVLREECDTVTSSQNLFDKAAFTVFPNPANDVFLVTSKQGFAENTSARLVDLNGKIVWEMNLTGRPTQFQIKTDAIAAGIYTLNFWLSEGYLSKRVVICH